MPSKYRSKRKAQPTEPERDPNPERDSSLYSQCQGPAPQHYRTYALRGRFDPKEEYGPEVDLYSYLYGREAPWCLYCIHDDVFINLPCPTNLSEHHCGDIVVSVDGAGRNNGSANVISSYGVYFAEMSSHNLSATVDALVHTGQRAELHACAVALEKVFDIQRTHNRGFFVAGFGPGVMHLTQVVIKADSAFLVSGMSEFLGKWKENGYKNAKGAPVANADLFESIDMAIDSLKDLGIEVAFWLVPRGHNREADGLVNEALDVVTS